MAIDVDTRDRVTMIFEKRPIRQKPIGVSTGREAIVAVMETLAYDERETAIIRGRWSTNQSHGIARRYANMLRMNVLTAAPPRAAGPRSCHAAFGMATGR